MLKSKSQSITLTYISLALVGLMWVFPFLHYSHKLPITTFYQEWWSALLGVLALCGLLARDYWRSAEMPRIVQLPIALIAVVVVQMAFGMIAYAGQGLLYILYLLFAALMMMLGARLRDCFGIEKLALILAAFLLVGAELSACLGLLQHYHLHTLLDTVLVSKISGTMYGNLAQSNHFANYTALGLVSLGLLFQKGRLRIAYMLPLAFVLLWVMALSSSRSSWLYLLMMSVLALWAGRNRAELRTLSYYCVMLLAGFLAVNYLVKLPGMGGGQNVSTLQRFSGADAFGGIRLYMWHEAWLMFASAPWLGVGFGQFSWQHFQMGPLLQRANLSGLYNNSHNLVFQLAAEAGMAGLAVLFATLGVWLYGLRRTSLTAVHWWGYAAIAVLAIHSLLEYPLWYVYFLAVAAILLGMLDENRYRLSIGNKGRIVMVVILLFGLSSLMLLRGSYRQLEGALLPHPAPANVGLSSPGLREQLAAVHDMPVLLPYAELYQSSLLVVNDEQVQNKLRLNTRVLRFMPVASVAYRQSLLLAQSGQQEQAKLAWEQAVWSYPYAPKQYQHLQGLAEKDPERFAALLEFALEKEQEYARAVHNK